MRNQSSKIIIVLLIISVLCLLSSHTTFAAAVETPKGKRIPGKIVDEAGETYKMETELPGGGKIIYRTNKENVDPHGTVPGTGRIEDIKGTAQIKRVGRFRFVKAYKNMIVNPGDQIKTGPDSEVVITLETTAVNGVGKDSHFTLKSLEKNPDTKAVQIEVGLPEGRLWSEVGKLKTDDSKFQVETPTAVTGVRGTVFMVEVAKATAETNVAVVTGKVAVNSRDLDVPEVVLNKREALSVKKGEKPSKLAPAKLLEQIVEIVKEWTVQSTYFKSVSALAGIGQVEEEIVVAASLPEDQRQMVYDEIRAGWEKASEDLFQIDKALKMYYLDFSHFPSIEEGGLNALTSNPGTRQWNGPYIEQEYLVDHYGVPYGYKLLRDAHGEVFVELTTFGYDKIPNTNDDRQRMVLEADAIRWEDRKSYR